MSNGDDDIFIYAIIGFFAGFYFFYKGFQRLKRKRLMENTPTSKIRGLAMGTAEVFGECLTAKDLIKTPYSSRDCLYYRYTIEEYRRSGKSSSWYTIKDVSASTHFYLKDETGQVLVDPNQAEVDIPSDKVTKIGNIRHTEYFISPSDKLYIIGSATDNPFVDEATVQQGYLDIMIAKGQNETTFYISDKSEKDCVNSENWKIRAEIFGGMALTLACMAYVLNEFGLLF